MKYVIKFRLDKLLDLLHSVLLLVIMLCAIFLSVVGVEDSVLLMLCVGVFIWFAMLIEGELVIEEKSE